MQTKVAKRVERHIVRHSKELDELCHKTKNLYNYANYLMRQAFINHEKVPSAFDLINRFTKENQINFRALPQNSAQQVILMLERNWTSFFKAYKEWKKNPNKFTGRPHLPKYKRKDGQFTCIFTCVQMRLKDGLIQFPKKANLKSQKTTIDGKLKQVRIIPRGYYFVVEVVYEKEIAQIDVDPARILAIDLGVNNLATLVTNIGNQPLLVSGRVLKSINAYWNKRRACLQSLIGNKGTSRLIETLTLKRNCRIDDYLHKTSAFIRDYCIEHKIGTVIIGRNKGWKNGVEIGKRNNQNFVSIPHFKLIQQLQYKLGDIGIEVKFDDEAYTSKCDALALEGIGQQENYLGKRVKRGLFQSSIGQSINADVNAALNIGRKVIGDSFIRTILDMGQVLSPLRIQLV